MMSSTNSLGILALNRALNGSSRDNPREKNALLMLLRAPVMKEGGLLQRDWKFENISADCAFMEI